MKLWLDDTRPAPPGWTLVKTTDDAIAVMKAREVDEMSLDHDLGTGKSGYDFCLWMAQHHKWPKHRPIVHSANPYGAMMMRGIISRYGPW